jgi:hypothetical protein
MSLVGGNFPLGAPAWILVWEKRRIWRLYRPSYQQTTSRDYAWTGLNLGRVWHRPDLLSWARVDQAKTSLLTDNGFTRQHQAGYQVDSDKYHFKPDKPYRPLDEMG